MVAQLQLHNLVDLALCDPELGAVNFNHLRTLLHCMLKLTNHSNNLVEECSLEISTTHNLPPQNVFLPENQQSYLEEDTADSVKNETPNNNDSVVSPNNESIQVEQQAEHCSTTSNKDRNADDDHDVNLNAVDIDKKILSQRNLELRLLNLEKSIHKIDETFPSNEEILNESKTDFCPKERMDNEELGCNNNQHPYQMDNGTLEILDINSSNSKRKQFYQIWQNKKIVRRLEATEETVDKLFSLMNDVLSQPQDKPAIIYDENKLDQCFQGIIDCRNDMQSNKAMIDQIKENLSQLELHLHGSVEEVKNVDTENNDLSKDMLLDSITSMINEKVENISSILNGKADKSELDDKVNSADFELLQNGIAKLTEEVCLLKENGMLNIDVSDILVKDDLNAFSDKLQLHITSADGTFAEIENDLQQLRKIIENIGDENLRNMLESSGQLDKLSSKDDEICVLQKKVDNIVIQVEQNMKSHEEVSSKLSDLDKVDENLLNTQEELRLLIPTFDASVLAAIQHLSQENRNQITALQTSLRMLQESQVMIQPSSSENISDEKLEMLDVFQNRLLSLQDEQIKQSGLITNMVGDYKEEFNRKQLHIDALYDYIDKLQNNKADKDEVDVEMNVKADKHALDSKVNMSTFDERYQMLEHSLQHALSRLDQYAEEENLLKSEFSKLSQDLNSKMDSDAEKKLKKFLDSRLKEIQESRVKHSHNIDLRNAAGLHKPMPLSYNCLSCDRPIDIHMRGVMPPIPNYLPSKKPLGSVKPEKNGDNLSKSKSNYAMTVNRSCGGEHTSVNINMLRMIKLNPITGSDSSHVKKPAEAKDLSDCVVGKDGQIYRGRFKLDGSHYVLNKVHSKDRLKTSSAKSVRGHKPKAENRSHSAELGKNDTACHKAVSVPTISHVSDTSYG